MNSIRSAIENTIPISLFNRGLAGKIFEEVKRYDARLLATAAQRMSHFTPSTAISQEQVDQEFGFTLSDYENTDDIEFE